MVCPGWFPAFCLVRAGKVLPQLLSSKKTAWMRHGCKVFTGLIVISGRNDFSFHLQIHFLYQEEDRLQSSPRLGFTDISVGNCLVTVMWKEGFHRIVQSCDKISTPHDSLACGNIFAGIMSVWLYLSFTSLWRNLGLLLFALVIQFIDICTYSFMHSTPVPSTAFQVQVWTLTESFWQLKSLLFQPLCCRFATVIGINIFLE